MSLESGMGNGKRKAHKKAIIIIIITKQLVSVQHVIINTSAMCNADTAIGRRRCHAYILHAARMRPYS